MEDILPERPVETAALNQELTDLARLTEAQQENITAGAGLDPEADELLAQRLRGLGYIE